MVKRYNHFGRDDLGYDYEARADQDEEGDWVRYEDYAQLEAALREAQGTIIKQGDELARRTSETDAND